MSGGVIVLVLVWWLLLSAAAFGFICEYVRFKNTKWADNHLLYLLVLALFYLVLWPTIWAYQSIAIEELERAEEDGE